MSGCPAQKIFGSSIFIYNIPFPIRGHWPYLLTKFSIHIRSIQINDTALYNSNNGNIDFQYIFLSPQVTIFQECQPEFLHDLVLKMKAYIFTPGDSICRKGEVAREMFIIADGILEVLSETGKVLTTMKAGDFFGEIGILNLDGLNK